MKNFTSIVLFGNGLVEKSHGRLKSLAGRNVFWKAREENLSALYNLSVWKVATVVGHFLVKFVREI